LFDCSFQTISGLCLLSLFLIPITELLVFIKT